ncbi:MAG: hypothetical protein JRF61_21220 [Deltaproteobacteria bacterium]|jgi:hypothetical protein|nr:hypothetical protein [Deltaproteobacteria bacterium]
MAHRLKRILAEAACRELMDVVDDFIEREFTRENVIARRTYVFDFGASDIDSHAFAIHYPGSAETADLPGYPMDELPAPLRKATRLACDEIGLTRGRVFFNVSRYIARAGSLPLHYDGELFDFSILPNNEGMRVHSGIRPSQVAVLTLENATREGGTWLASEGGEVFTVRARPGELLCFDNLTMQHGVPDMEEVTQAADAASGSSSGRPWIRYSVGWRAFEDRCFRWADGEPLEPLSLEEAADLHRHFLSERWPGQIAGELSRAAL